MDRKTLKWMEQRVAKGREIANRINELAHMKRRIYDRHSISFSAGKYAQNDEKHYRLGENDSELPRTFRERAQERMITVLIEEINNETAALEQELAEL